MHISNDNVCHNICIFPDGQGTDAAPNRCLIHICPTDDSRLNLWNEENWKVMCAAAAAWRNQKNFASSKYHPIIQTLPDNPSATDGYHSKCYKNFTAVKKVSPAAKPDTSTSLSQKRILRSPVASISARSERSAIGILPDCCLFCNKKTKKRPNGTNEYLGKIQTKQAAETIMDIVQTLKMDSVLVKIAGIDLIAKEVPLHHSCRANLILKSNRAKTVLPVIDEESELKDRSKPLNFILAYVSDSIICKKRPEHLQSVYKRYEHMCVELDIEPPITKVDYFGDVLTKNFPDKLILHSPKTVSLE